MLINSIVVVMALLGAYTTWVLFIKRKHKCTYEYAIWYVSETIKDIVYNRYSHWIHCTELPNIINSEMKHIFPLEVSKKWDNILTLKSVKTQSYGVSTDGVAFYSFVIPWDENYSEAYSSIIESQSKDSLSNMHCTITDTIVRYHKWRLPDYRICEICYARTAAEQTYFRRIQANIEKRAIGGNSSEFSELHDKELDDELKKFIKGDHDDSN